MRTVIVSLCLALAACGGEPPPDPDERCATLRDHLAELRAGEATADSDQHRAALAAALDDGAWCESLDDDAASCLLAAADHDTARDCLGPEGE